MKVLHFFFIQMKSLEMSSLEYNIEKIFQFFLNHFSNSTSTSTPNIANHSLFHFSITVFKVMTIIGPFQMQEIQMV